MVKSNSLRGDEIERLRALLERAARIDRDLGADHADLELGIGRLQRAAVFTSEANDGVEVCSTTRS